MFRILIMAMLLLSGLGLCSCTDDKPVRIAMVDNWLGYQTLPLATEMGLIDPSMVELTITNSNTASVDALRQGRVDAAAITLDEAIRLCSEGMTLKVIAIFDISAGADVILSRYDANTLQQMQQISLVYEKNGLGALLLHWLIHHYRLDKDTITSFNIPVSRQMAYINTHQPDMIISYEPIASSLQQAGYQRLADTRKIAETIFDVLVVKTTALESAPKLWSSIAQGERMSIDYLIEKQSDAIYRLAKVSGVAKTEVEATLRNLILPNSNYAHRLLGGDEPRLAVKAQEIYHTLVAADAIQSKRPDCAAQMFH